MIINSLHVQNFRSLLAEKLDCHDLTVLVGRNGTGKSSFLRALEIFYDPTATVSVEDFYADDSTKEILVSVTFSSLSEEERKLFEPYLDDDQLTVARVFALSGGNKSGTYHGMRLQNPEFSPVRDAGGKKDITNKYKELREQAKYSSLPVAKSADDALSALKEWGSANSASCVRQRDDGQFFGFTEVGQGYLGRHTRFIRIPAVRDAVDDATERRGSCVTELMDLVVRSTLANRADFVALKEETQKKYKDVMDPGKLTELTELQSQLTETLKCYAPEASVSLEWANLTDLDFPLPKAEVKIQEDGYRASVQRTGHGLQRAFILTMLQHLVVAKGTPRSSDSSGESEGKTEESGVPALPSLVLAIEEPELYQHPSRQRHMAAILSKLAIGTIPGVAKKTQVLYTTHSPLFVGLDRFDQINLLRKEDHTGGKPRITKVTKTALDSVAEELWVAGGKQGDKYTADTLRPRLQAVLTPWVNEGFFADVTVLVEGEDDRAAILGAAKVMGHDFDSSGIAVIPCVGKSNLDRPLVIFRQFGIPVYLMWDSDHGEKDAKPDSNRYLLRLLGQAEDDWPNQVMEDYACFKVNLEQTLSDEIGKESFDQFLSEVQGELGIPKRSHALKNPIALERVIAKASSKDKTSPTLKKVVESILALKPKQAMAA